MNVPELIAKLHWLGHDSFRLDGPPVIYFDPWKLKGQPPLADLVLVSHEHADHCSPGDIAKITGPDTVVVCNTGSADKLPGARTVRPGDSLTVVGVEIEAVRAYNLDKFRSPGVLFHPREANHVGYIVTVDSVRIYHAGDTDHIPEMADFECDIALLPVSGTYVMTAEEAAEAARTIQPQTVVPMHYGAGIGTADDGSNFTDIYAGDVVLLEAE